MAEGLERGGDSVRDQLLQFVHDVCVIERGVGVYDWTDEVAWPKRTDETPYPEIKAGFMGEYQGFFPYGMQLGRVQFETDDGAAMVVWPGMDTLDRDPFAQAFLDRLRWEFTMHDHDFCMAGLRRAQEADAEAEAIIPQGTPLVTLRAPISGHVVVA